MRVVTVLKSGGDYSEVHAERLKRQVEEHAPGAEFICLTDMRPNCETIPLIHGWPGWWSKLELFRPDLTGDFLFMDLDTVLVDDITPLFTGRLTILRDFYRRYGLQSSLMYLPESDRDSVWSDWIEQPQQHMKQHKRGGDQTFLEQHYMHCDRWQIAHPGAVVSFKADCCDGKHPKGARIVIFHGKPRPWDCGQQWAM